MCDLDRNILRIEQKFTNDPQTDLGKPRQAEKLGQNS